MLLPERKRPTLAQRLAWLVPLFLERLFGMGGIVSAALWAVGAMCAAWAVLDELHFRGFLPKLRRSHSVGIAGVVLVISFVIGQRYFFSMVPTPTYTLENQPYNFADGLEVYGVTWSQQMRAVTISLSNPWNSAEMRDAGFMVMAPTLIVHSELIIEGNVEGGVIAPGVENIQMKDAGTVKRLTNIEHSNMIYFKSKLIHPGGKISLNLVLRYDSAPLEIANLSGGFAFRSDFGRSIEIADHFRMQVANDQSRAISLVPWDGVGPVPILLESDAFKFTPSFEPPPTPSTTPG